MISAFLLLLCNSLFLSLHLSGGTGSFPKPLTAAQEREYLRRCAEGDMEARNLLVEHNLRLVAHIMKKYYTQADDQEDLISIGTIGLIKAVNTFRADKGIRLATYASRCIENAILSQRNNRQLRWKTMNLLGQNGLCITSALSGASRRRLPVPASAPWSRAASGHFSAPDRTGTLPAPVQAPALPAVISEKSEILPSLSLFPESLMVHFMRDFGRICRRFAHCACQMSQILCANRDTRPGHLCGGIMSGEIAF